MEGKTAAELLVEKEQISQENTKLQGDLDEAKKTISDLKKKLKDADAKPKVAGPETVKVGEDTYAIPLNAFIFERELRTAEDVKSDKDLAARLVEAGVVLEKIVK